MSAGLARALSLFTVAPVRVSPELGPTEAARSIAWLPVVGLALGAISGLPVTAVRGWVPHAALVGAVLGVAVLAVLTRGLHLDGLADTADGLGSRAPAERALQIMRQSDIGPFGVITLMLVLLLDVAASTQLGGGVWTPVAALAVAAATGRLAVVHATLPRVPTARGDGFGALVRGATSARLAVVETLVVLAAGGAIAWWVGDNVVWWVGAQIVALLGAFVLRLHTTRRFGGTTGDVYGALVETATVVTLVALALH